MKRKKRRNKTPAQRVATIRNQHKGRVTMMKGLILWMLLSPQKDSLHEDERRKLVDISAKLIDILRNWSPTL
jgi:hypothetical protein